MTPNLLLAGADGVDFMIHGVFKYNFLGHEVWITTSHVCLLIVVVCLLIFFFIGGQVFRHAKAIPGTFQCILEFLVEFLDGITDGAMGKKGKGFRNYIGVLFLFILFSNISGLLGLRPPTADYGVTLPLGLITPRARAAFARRRRCFAACPKCGRPKRRRYPRRAPRRPGAYLPPPAPCAEPAF